MADTLKAFDTQVNDLLETYVRKPTLIKGVVHLLLILYAAKLAPQLPASVLKIFDNSYFKLFIFSLILWTAQFSPSTAILIAIAFLVSTNYLSNKPLFEFLENTNMAMDSAMQNIQPVMVDNKVHYIQNEETTMVIQPKLVDHEGGQIVVNPSVVISPIIVTTPDGKTATVTPKVTTITTGSSGSTPSPSNASPDHVHDSPVANSSASNERNSIDMNEVKPLNFGDMNHLKMPEIPVEVGKDAKIGIENPPFASTFDFNKVVSYDTELEYGTFTSN
jgi:hypothetical protein